MLKHCQNCEKNFEGARNISYCGTCLKKNCVYCGEEFHPRTKQQKYCSNPHTENCFNCGMRIKAKIVKNKEDYSCSKKSCQQRLREETSLRKYGVNHPTQSTEVKAKIKKTFKKNYGGHPSQSREVQEKTRQTNLKRYGVVNPANSEKVKEKTAQTNLRKYGKKYIGEVPEVKQRIKETNKKRYGVETPLKNNEVREKIRTTNKKKYGVENVFASKTIQEKIKETVQKKYGVDYIVQSEEMKKKTVETNLKKYGVENAAQSKEVQEKTTQTNLERYGVENPAQTPETQAKIRATNLKKYRVFNPTQQGITNYEDYLNFENFVKNGDYSIPELAKHFNLTEHAIRRKVRDKKLDEHIIGRYSSSVLEESFNNFLKKLDVEFLRNDRKILGGKELDFYFPELMLAVELSPTSTHNITMKYKNYHLEKFFKAKEKGVELITFFDWMNWEELLEKISLKTTDPKKLDEFKYKMVKESLNIETTLLNSFIDFEKVEKLAKKQGLREVYIKHDNAFGFINFNSSGFSVKNLPPVLRNLQGREVPEQGDSKNLVYDCGGKVWFKNFIN